MGLFLNRDKNGEYRRVWYCKVSEGGRLTGRKLKTPLRGKIPLDGEGRFSIALKGDAAFEKSKAAASVELKAILDKAREMKAEERNAPGYLERETFRKIRGREFEIVAIADLADRNAERARYALTGNRRKDGNRRAVYDILSRFSKWCADRNGSKPKKRLKTLADIDRETVAAYYLDLARSYSWETISKNIFTLAGTFRYFMDGVTENPFRKVYEDEYKRRRVKLKGDVYLDKSSVTHEAPTPEQVRQLWECARQDVQHPFLYRLAVVAACTGMRIGDCCNLTWGEVDMTKHRITKDTRKTGSLVSVPILDYRPEAADYSPLFGELRRELEAAVVENEGSPFVMPEAAAIYARDPDRISKLGKRLFAVALFSEPEPEDARLVGDATAELRPIDVMRLVEAAPMQEAKRARLLRTYELRSQGKSYSQICRAIGGRKGVVSDDLAEIERIAGVRIRPGVPKMTIRGLVRRTRKERKQGMRSACLFGWHSLRVFFVVAAIDAGMKPEKLKLVTGHSTDRMVMHYYNPRENAAAENLRHQLRSNDSPAQIDARTPLGARGAVAGVLPLASGADAPQGAEGVANVAHEGKTAAGRLREAKSLLDAGLITLDEFAAKRKEIIDAV